MFRMKYFAIAALCLLVFVPDSARSADLSPYLDEETIAVVRINLKQLDIPEITKYYETALMKAIDELIPGNDPIVPQLKQQIQTATAQAPMVSQFYDELVVKCKLEEIHAIVYRDALVKRIFPVLLAVPVPENASQETIDTIRMQYLNSQIPVTFVRHGFIVGIPVIPEQFASQQKVMAFAKEKFKFPSSQSRPEITTALSSQSGALLQLVIGRIDQFQKDVETQINAFRPMLMMMPKEQRDELNQVLKMVPILFQNLNSYSFAYDYGKPEIKSVIQFKDEKIAKDLFAMYLELMKQAETALAQVPTVKSVFEIQSQQTPGITPEGLAAIKNLVKAVQMKQQGNEVTMLLDSSGMEHLKTYLYEMGIKYALATQYTVAKNFGGGF